MTSTTDKLNSEHAQEQIESVIPAHEAVDEPIRQALASDQEPLQEWARERGREIALSGGKPNQVMKEVLAAARAAADGQPDDELLASLTEAAFESYVPQRIVASTHGAREEALRGRVAELTALHRINSAANSSLKLSDMLHEVAQAVVAVTRADICSIFLYEVEWDQLVLAATTQSNQSALNKVRLRIGEGITGSAVMAGRPIAASNAWEDPRFRHIPELDEDRVVSMLAVPVVLYTKEKLVGVITLQTFEKRDFSEDEVKFLETVAGEMAIAIENARLYEQTDSQLRQKVTELSTLQGVSAHIAATLNLPEVLTLIAYQAARLVNADASAIYELHPEAGTLELVARYDLEDPNYSIHRGKAGPHPAVSIEESGIAFSIIRGIPAALPPEADSALDLPFTREGYGSMFCVPLVAPRAIMGGICLYSREARTFSEDQIRLLDAFAHEAAIALENSRLYDAALRGLRTKSLMLQEMNHRVRNNLQIVAGLLSMQLRRVPPESDAATAVRESVARIQSIAVVHDLMTSGEVESTTVYDLARRVADAEILTFSNESCEVKINIEQTPADEIRVGSQQAMLLALLLNELISNAIMHGFEGSNGGTINIRAWIESGETPYTDEASVAAPRPCQMVVIEVTDDGTGLPTDFSTDKDAHLGLNIVRTLVLNDLGGEFTIEPRAGERGTVARVSFTTERAP